MLCGVNRLEKEESNVNSRIVKLYQTDKFNKKVKARGRQIFSFCKKIEICNDGRHSGENTALYGYPS